MRILVAVEKHSTRYLAANTDEELEASARKLIEERLDRGYYCDEEDKVAARLVLEGLGIKKRKRLPGGSGWEFLEERAAGEYEGVSLEEVERADQE